MRPRWPWEALRRPLRAKAKNQLNGYCSAAIANIMKEGKAKKARQKDSPKAAKPQPGARPAAKLLPGAKPSPSL